MAGKKKMGGGKKAGAKSGAKKGMGFNAAAAQIQRKSGVSPQAARAILAASARKASPAAKRANPNLKHVLPKKKGGK